MSRPTNPPDGLSALGLPAEPGSLYELALTHRSFAFEQPEPAAHNERLEFLGDAVLGALVTDLIYRTYPELSEGEMARLRASVVSTPALALTARALGLGAHIRLGRGEEASGGRDKASLLADTFEALVGAAYLDKGAAELAIVLTPHFAARLDETVASGGGHDAKTALQEAAVRLCGLRPSYRVAASGPDHAKVFTAEVYIRAEHYGDGRGSSKKDAEQDAAGAALDRLRREAAAEGGTVDARAG